MTVVTVTVRDFEFVSADGTNELTVPPGTQVTFDFQAADHTVVTDPGDAINADPININNGNGNQDAVSPVPQKRVVTIEGESGGEIRYYCGIHGQFMKGIIHISHDGGHQPATTVTVRDFEFVSADGTNELTVPPDTEVTFDFQAADHTVVTDNTINADPININNGNGEHDAVPFGQKKVVTIKGDNGGEISYHCGIHGTFMNGIIHIS